jgi:hypothetical protein
MVVAHRHTAPRLAEAKIRDRLTVARYVELRTEMQVRGDPTLDALDGARQVWLGRDRSAPALGSHGYFVPQIDLIAVGVGQLGAVSPHQLLRGLDELDAFAHEFAMLPINIFDLNDQGTFCAHNLLRDLAQENRESGLVLDRDSFGLGIFELDFEPQSFQVPGAGPLAVRNRQRQVIEFQHGGSRSARGSQLAPESAQAG